MSATRLCCALSAVLVCTPVMAANPLRVVGETFTQWKERLFGEGRAKPDIVDAPAAGPVKLATGEPTRIVVDRRAPERDFPDGRSRYRIVELPAPVDAASLRVQVIARDNPDGRGNVVFKPLLYVLGDDDEVASKVEVAPMHVDIRPFRRTRLLGCAELGKVRRFAIATTPKAVGKAYEAKARNAVKAPTRGGFYYSTDAVKLRLPYAGTGEVVIELAGDAAESCERT